MSQERLFDPDARGRRPRRCRVPDAERCTATTNRGTRCTRRSLGVRGRCSMHEPALDAMHVWLYAPAPTDTGWDGPTMFDEDRVLLPYGEVVERDFEGMSGVPLGW